MKTKYISIFIILLLLLLSSLFFAFRFDNITNIIVFAILLVGSRLLYLRLIGKLKFSKSLSFTSRLFENPSKSINWFLKNILTPVILGWLSTYIYGYILPNPDSDLLEGQTELKQSQVEINDNIENIYELLRTNDESYIREILTNLFGVNYKSVLQNSETYENLILKLDNKSLNEILNENIVLRDQLQIFLGNNFSEKFIEEVSQLFNDYRYSEVNTLIDKYIESHQYISNSFLAKLYALKAKSFAYTGWYKMANTEMDKALVLDANNDEIIMQHAYILKSSGQLDAALDKFMDLLVGKGKKVLEGEEVVFSIMDDIIDIRIEKRQFAMALDLLKPILEERNSNVEENPSLRNTIDLMVTYEQLANTYIGLNDFEKANLFHEKVADFKLNISADNEVFKAQSYNQKGKIYDEQGKYKLALEQFLLAKEATVKEDSLAHDLLYIYNNIGKTYHRLGEYKKAWENLGTAYVLSVSDLGEHNPQTGYILVNMGNLLNDYRAFDDALGFIEMAEEIFIKNFGLEDRNLIRVYNLKGNAFIGRSEFDKAKFYLEKGIVLALDSYGYETMDVGVAYGNLGVAYSGLGHRKKAIENFKKSINLISEFHSEGHYYIDVMRKNLKNEESKSVSK